jgi:hypothetical protein
MGPGSSPRTRAAWEVFLFILGENELDAVDDRRLFYQVERDKWSRDMTAALNRLDRIRSVEDALLLAESSDEADSMEEAVA